MASAYFQYTENLIDRIRTFYPDGKSISMSANLNKGITYGAEFTAKVQLMPFWDATANFNFFKNEIYGSNLSSGLNNSGSSWFTKLNSNFRLPKNFSVQVSGSYEAPKVAAQGRVLEVYWLDVAVRKNFLNNKANLVFNISDIFNTRKYTTLYDFPGAQQSIYRDRETRIANITLTYRFGKSEAKSSGNRRNPQSGPAVKDRDNLKQGDDSGGF
jgi:outer membrane receptor protein involved in Fe transport